jgi:hypothetical protein
MRLVILFPLPLLLAACTPDPSPDPVEKDSCLHHFLADVHAPPCIDRWQERHPCLTKDCAK